MKKILPAFFIGATVFFSFCNSRSTSAPATTSTDTTAPASAPVPQEAPNSDYKPAFPGQTRIGAVKTTTPYAGTILTKELKLPWGIATLPDGRFLITERENNDMRIVTPEGAVSEPITGLPKINFTNQGGLLGLALDPDFATNRIVYWAFSAPDPKGDCTALGKGKLSADEKKIENATVIYRALPAFNSGLHYGGRVVFARDGNLFLSTGERSDLRTRPQAQQLNSALGKVLRLTKDGKPAPGNPFEHTDGAKPEIYSWGHRNVQGLAINPETQELWEDEFGPRGGDEVNLIRPGKNYGWATITYGIEYSGKKVGDSIQQKEGLEQPVYYWDPVVSPSGSTFYNGDNMPEWKGNLFIACLSSQHITRLVIKNDKVTGEENLLSDEKQRFRDITQGKDGALYAITDDGRLYRIAKK